MNQRIGNTLFDEAEWLNAVAPGQWAAVEVDDGSQVVGRLPFVLKQRYGIRVLGVPPLTPWLGPWVRSFGGKPSTELSRQHGVIAGLIEQLPRAHHAFIPAPPEFSNLLSFYWTGYKIQAAYTYRLLDLTNQEEISAGFDETVRRELKKARRGLSVDHAVPLNELLSMIRFAFGRQGLGTPPWQAALTAVYARFVSSGRAYTVGARLPDGSLAGAALFIGDDRHTFYLCGGADPARRTTGAQTLIMTEAISIASQRSKIFDFEGSMIQGVERFFRGFGAAQTIRLSATRESVVFGAAKLLRRRVGSFSR